MNHILAPTITVLPDDIAGRVVVTASHGGRYPGHLVLAAKARAAIFNDAGIGRKGAGIAALALLQDHGKAAAAVSNTSARIGDADDMIENGIISSANAAAAACGVTPGMRCAEAALLLEVASFDPTISSARPEEARGTWTCARQTRGVTLIDSASLATSEDAGAIIITGSHGGLIGGDPKKALRVDGFAAIFNDAGIGKDDAGVTRLPALNARGIAAFTVSASSACIGSARSTLQDGLISRLNGCAADRGARIGQRARNIVLHWATH